MAQTQEIGGGVLSILKTKMSKMRSDYESTCHKNAEAETMLRREIECRLSAESQAQSLSLRIQALEAEQQKVEEQAQSITARVNQVQKRADELERERKVLENKSTASETQVSQLENSIRQASEAAQSADRRADETIRRLRAAEQQVEDSEKRATAAEKRIREMEAYMRTVQTTLRSREFHAEKAAEREAHFVAQLKAIGDRLREAQRRAEIAERDAVKRQLEIQELEAKRDQERSRHRALRDEFDRYARELQNL